MNFEALRADLLEAVHLAQVLGLEGEAEEARRVLLEADERIGLTSSNYTLALVGGTGVGKSSLLNALAGTSVSDVSVLRPTTEDPVAWVRSDNLDDVSELMEWLDIQNVVAHESEDFRGVALLDLPDFDSVATEHKMTVDRLLPRLDAVIWVVDPQKYDDERLYEYLRPRGRREAVVEIAINKIDLLSGAELEAVSADIRQRLAAVGVDPDGIHQLSAADGTGIQELIEVIRERAASKQVVLEKLELEMKSTIKDLAVGAGAEDFGRSPGPSPSVEKVTEGVLGVIDPDGLSAQVANAHLSKARLVAGSILTRLTGLFRLVSGSKRRTGDPVRYLRTWRSRGDLSRATNALRDVYVDATGDVPARLRAGVLESVEPAAIKDSLTEAVDEAVISVSRDIEVSTPWTWRVLSFFQIVALIGLLGSVAWLLTIWLGPIDLIVGSVEVWLLGEVPTPIALLVGSLILSLLVGGLVRLAAIWRGKRAARRVELALRQVVDAHVADHGLQRLNAVVDARARLGEIYRSSQS